MVRYLLCWLFFAPPRRKNNQHRTKIRAMRKSYLKIMWLQRDRGFPAHNELAQRSLQARVERRRLVAGEQLLDLAAGTGVAVVGAVQLPLLGRVVIEQL